MQEYINGKVLLDGKLVKKNFLIKDSKIYFSYKPTNKPKDIKGMVVSPSFVDLHVHARVPGYEYKEDVQHLTAAALAGGFTTLVTMANVDPAPYDYETLKYVQGKFDQSNINIIQAGRVTFEGQLADLDSMVPFVKIFTDDGLPISNSGLMNEALMVTKKNGSLILLHEENESIKGHAYHSQFSIANNIPSFGSKYEFSIIKRDLDLNKSIKAAIHFQHISCLESIRLLKKAKSYMDISAEVTPHHLFFSSDSIEGSTNLKMNPPLHSFQHTKALRKALVQGVINIIATDHAPHAQHEKNKPWAKAANGVIGLETAFAVVNTVMGEKHLTKVLMALSVNPAQRIGLDVDIKDGQQANIVIIDPREEWVFTKENIKSKSKNSPWIDMKLKGRVKEVIWTKKSKLF